MKKKIAKIIVDSLMLVTLIATLATMRGNMLVHTIIGGLFALLMAVHIWQTIKWMIGVGKRFKKVKPKIRRHFIMNMTLTTMWLVCIITGILAGVHTLTGIDALFVVRRIHGVTGVIACVLTVIHVIQHRRRLMGLFKRKKRKENKVSSSSNTSLNPSIEANDCASCDVARDCFYTKLALVSKSQSRSQCAFAG